MTTVIDTGLTELLTSAERIFWAGRTPPLARMHASEDMLDPARDYRMSADCHQAFDLVYLTERNLGTLKAWPLIVDEALRLLRPGGVLVIRMTNTPLCSVFALKNQLFLWGDMVPYAEFTCADGSTQFAVRNIRTSVRSVSLGGFSFGVITDGSRQAQLFSFLRSVREVRRLEDEPVELLVCGPEAIRGETEALFPELVFVADDGHFAEQGWITHKKNRLVEHASHENLVITHDRYTIEPDFIEGLRKFGGDFALLVCRLVRPDGRRFPDWIALGADWSWATPAMLEYGDFNRYMYVNGSFIIAKKQVLQRLPWNELVFWQQAEDVELTRRMMSAGIVPRLARAAVAVSHMTRPGMMEAFEPVPALADRYLVSGQQVADGEYVTPSLPYAQEVHFGERWGELAARMGVYCNDAWHSDQDGLGLVPGTYGEVSFRLPDHDLRPRELWLTVQTAGALEVLVNNVAHPTEMVTPSTIRITVATERFSISPVCRVEVRATTSAFRLKGLRVQPADWSLGQRLPVTRELAHEMVNRSTGLAALDGGSLCLGDLPLLVRGARRIAVLVPADLHSLIENARFLTAIREYTRSDTNVRIVADGAVHTLLEGFESQVVDWERFGTEFQYRQGCIGELNAFAPDLIINAFPSRELLPDLIVLSSHALGSLGFERCSYEFKDGAGDLVRIKYSRLLNTPSGSESYALMRALDLPDAGATLWPDLSSSAIASSLMETSVGGGGRVLALLGDDLTFLSQPSLPGLIEQFLGAGWSVVGLGESESRHALESVLSHFSRGVLNLAGTATVSAMFAILQQADAYLGGGTLFRAFATLAGCRGDVLQPEDAEDAAPVHVLLGVQPPPA